METAIAILIGSGCTAVVAVLIHLLSISRRWGRFEKTVEDIEKTVRRIESTIKEHGERIIALETRADVWNGGDTQRKSPVTLTEQGAELLKESGAEECIEKKQRGFAETV